MRISKTFLFLILAAFAAGMATSDAAARGMSDKDFVAKAASGSKMEIDLGEIALKQASNNEVKNFAQRMVNDHGMASQELTSIAERERLSVPRDMDRSNSSEVQHLSKLSGPDFDRAYMDHMVKDHQEDIGMFTRMATEGKNPDLKNFAKKTLPTLEDHLRMATAIRNNLKQKGGSTNG